MVKTSRETLSKSVRKRKEDARLRVEIICDREEAFKTLRSGPINGNPLTSVNPCFRDNKIREREDDGINDMELIHVPVTTAPRLHPSSGIVRLEGELFGQILEFWGFLSTFAQPLKVLTIPSIPHLCSAVRACEPSLKKLRLNSRGADRSFESVSAKYVQRCVRVCVCLCLDMYVCVCVYVCMYVYMFAWMDVDMCACVCMCVCVSKYVCYFFPFSSLSPPYSPLPFYYLFISFLIIFSIFFHLFLLSSTSFLFFFFSFFRVELDPHSLSSSTVPTPEEASALLDSLGLLLAAPLMKVLHYSLFIIL